MRRIRSVPDGEDLCQAVFERVVAKLADVDPAKVRAYCFAAARHALADYYRHRSLAVTSGIDVSRRVSQAETSPSAQTSRSADLARARISGWIPAEIDALPLRYREPLKLFTVEGRSTADIAGQLGLSVPAVKVRLHRARQMLVRNIDACCRLLRDARGRVFDYEERRPEERCPAGCV